MLLHDMGFAWCMVSSLGSGYTFIGYAAADVDHVANVLQHVCCMTLL